MGINANEIAQQIFAQQDPDAMPVVLCRRHVPHKMTYVLHDYTWEGLKRVTRAGKPVWEIDKDFVLTIEIDGTCRIPQTKQNMARLEFVSKPRKTMATQRDFDYATGNFSDREVEVIEPPMYERIGNNLMQQSTVDNIAAQVMSLMKNPKVIPDYDYGDEPSPVAQETNFTPLPVVERVGPRTDESGMQVGEETFGPETAIVTPPVSLPVPKAPGRPRGGRKPSE